MTENTKHTENTETASNTWFHGLISFLRLTHEQEDPEIVHKAIESGIVFRGTNLWILIFAILVASVGLNMNSTAVIIGAMLISPLMGPINGVGYSVATYDFVLLRKSLNNYLFATTAALVTSTMYFTLTPIHTEHSELLARTSPTIYDVLIALFGGLAGVVAISSKTKGNVIPGVAIATALMPPLCTAGYGVSIGNWFYFFGALYLFLINSVFIALSSMLVAQVLKYPKRTSLLSSQIKNKNIAIIVVIALTVLPSVYLGYTLVKKEQFINVADQFVQEVSIWEGNYLLDKHIDDKSKTITLIYGGAEFDARSKELLRGRADDAGLKDAKLDIRQGLKTNDYSLIEQGQTEVSRMEAEVSRLKSTLAFQESKVDSLRNVPKLGGQLLKEINSIYPQVKSCTYSESYRYTNASANPVHVSIVNLELSDSLDLSSQARIRKWLTSRLDTKSIILNVEQ